MKLSELFHSQVTTVAPQDTVRAAVAKMKHDNVGAVVVTESGKVAGILTDRDIALKVTLGPATADSPVADVMTRNVVTIWDDQGVFNATQYLRGHKVRRLPIIERDGRLVGMLAADDLFGLLARELLNAAEGLEPAIGAKV
ncbi:MAG: hypothetical protein RLY70_2494 [Planctomycetota bacterium]|jgi:CBS domain-containing protein